MHDLLTGYSRAMYANWLWHRSLQLVIDAGEGLQLALGSSVFQPAAVAITHGHSDHILGLPGFVAARRFGKGATDKPLTIFHPAGSRGAAAMREVLASVWHGVDFPVAWVALADGEEHPFGGRLRALQAMPARHVEGEPAVGYRVLETRRRLKPEFAGLPQAEVEQLARRQGRATLMEEFRHVVFAHSGDAMPIDPELVRGADLLVHDATFLDEADRRMPIHATTEEALQVARAAGVRALVLYHLSIRYDRDAALPRLKTQLEASGFAGPCWLLDEGALIPLR